VEWNYSGQHKSPGTINLTFTEKIEKTKATLKGTWMVSYPLRRHWERSTILER
jgi:hypothetical protein